MNRQTAAAVAESALQAVFDSVVVSGMREDTELGVAGYGSHDAIALADAVTLAAATHGEACRLTDADFDAIATVHDLIAAIERETVGPTEGDA